MEQYIPKSVVVAEIERLITPENGYSMDKLLDFIDTLEVKEVDLDFQTFAKEMDAIFALPSSETKNTEEEPLNWEYAIAKHFFELGLREQNRWKPSDMELEVLRLAAEKDGTCLMGLYENLKKLMEE